MTTDQINNWIKEAHENAVEKGFYDCPECGNPIVKCNGAGQCDHNGTECTLKDNCGEFEPKCSTCHGTRIDPHKDIGELLMMIVSEMGEALEAHRKGRFADWARFETIKNYKSDSEILISFFETDIKDTFEDEIADVFIRLFDLCGYLGIDLRSDYPSSLDYALWNNNTVGSILLLSVRCIAEIQKPDIDKKEIKLRIESGIGYLFTICRSMNIPIEKHIEAKMAYNKQGRRSEI